MKYQILNSNHWTFVIGHLSLVCIFSVLLFALSSMRFAMQVHAQTPQQSLRVYPVVIDVPLLPGQPFQQTITLENLSDKPLPLRANLTDFQTEDEDGGYVFPDTHTNPLLSWTNVSPSELILPAHSKETVALTIATPKNVPIGGYYGMLFFEPVGKSSAQTTQVIGRIGVLLLGSIGVPDPNTPAIQILTFDHPLFSQDKTLPFTLRVKDTALQHITAKPILTITPLFGTASKQYWEEKVVFPGKVRRWQSILSLPSTLGVYQLRLAVSSGNGQQVFNQSTVIVFPYLPFLAVILVVFIVWLSAKKRRQITRAFRVLVTNKEE